MPSLSDSNIAAGYALTEAGGVLRGRDGAYIPPDPANADWLAYVAWRESGGVAASQTAAFDPAAIAAECQGRIYAVASQNCQINMTAFIASGQATEPERDAFNSALSWVQAMRSAYHSLVEKQASSFAENSSWPACPDEARAFANRF